MSVPFLISVIIALGGLFLAYLFADRVLDNKVKALVNDVSKSQKGLLAIMRLILKMEELSKLLDRDVKDDVEHLRKIMDDSGSIYLEATKLLTSLPEDEDPEVKRVIIRYQETAKKILDRFSLLHAKAQQKA